jgi:hypothetical protein
MKEKKILLKYFDAFAWKSGYFTGFFRLAILISNMTIKDIVDASVKPDPAFKLLEPLVKIKNKTNNR